MTAINNKRIVVNTVFLYLRMLVLMGISLYTVRITLDILGVEDYGIYNVIAGVVSIFSFIKGSLATSSQRYFSIELAKGDMQSLNKQFCLNLTVFFFLSLIILIFLETIGLYFVNTKLVIPQNRLYAANVIYQLSIITLIVQLISVPYDALIVSYEKMSAFAYIGITEAVFKLIVVWMLMLLPFDNLIVYGILMLLFACVITFVYYVYCKKNTGGSDYHFLWDKKSFIELFSFTGWHFLGTISVAIKSQGINILINTFFNPAINAARAISFQIENSLSQLYNNFFAAVKPQIYKAYANKEFESLFVLINRSTIICAFLMSILSLPLIVFSDYILSLWLKQVPPYTVIFTQLILINGIIDSVNGSTIAPALATGKIKKYQLVVATLLFLNLPISYIALKIGCDATWTIIVSIVISIFAVVVRAILLKQMMGFSLLNYLKIMFKILISTFLCLFILMQIRYVTDSRLVAFVINTIASTTILIMLYWLFVCVKGDRKRVLEIIKNNLSKKTRLKLMIGTIYRLLKLPVFNSLIPSIIFCFKYLPFKQAIKLPILVYKPKFISLKGEIIIDAPKIQFGMINLGFLTATPFPNTGIILNIEGKIIFHGTCIIGNNSSLVIGKQGTMEFGNDFRSTTSSRLISFCHVSFGKSCRLGWDVTVMDTNFHPIYDMKKKKFKKAFGPITIGDYNWLGYQCLVMHSVITPERCIFGAKSIINRGGNFESYCVYGGNPVRILSRDSMLIYEHESISDYSL